MMCFIRFMISVVFSYSVMAIEIVTRKLNGNEDTRFGYHLAILVWRSYQKINCPQYRQVMDDGLGPELTEYLSQNEL